MKKIATVTLSAAAALALAAGPAVAGPGNGNGPKDGKCVSNGVQALSGAQKAAAARGELPVSLQFIIDDHLTNGADATEALLEVTICE